MLKSLESKFPDNYQNATTVHFSFKIDDSLTKIFCFGSLLKGCSSCIYQTKIHRIFMKQSYAIVAVISYVCLNNLPIVQDYIKMKGWHHLSFSMSRSGITLYLHCNCTWIAVSDVSRTLNLFFSYRYIIFLSLQPLSETIYESLVSINNCSCFSEMPLSWLSSLDL